MTDRKQKIRKMLYGLFLICCFTAIAFYILMESPLNPWSEKLSDIDSAIFVYFGKAMYDAGQIPYRDMFDHKGPLLWLIEYIGVALGRGSTTGIWFLELITMTFDIAMAYLCARKVCRSRFISLLMTGLSFVPLIAFLYGGNLSEEWALPFIYASLYIYLDYLINDKLSFLRISAAGACCGAVLSIRPNMIAVWAVFSLWILADLILKKEWKKAGLCVTAFFTGCAAVMLPFVIYYAAYGQLGQMWYDYISFNILYCNAYGGFKNIIPVVKEFLGLSWLLWIPALVLGMYLMIFRRKSWQWILEIFVFVSIIMAGSGGRVFIHYAIIFVPCITVMLAADAEGMLVISEKIPHFSKRAGYLSTVAILCIISAMYVKHNSSFREQPDKFRSFLTSDEKDDGLIAYIRNNTESGDPIMFNGMNSKYYYTSGHYCNNRNFIQHVGYSTDDALYREIISDIDTNPPRLVIFRRYNVDGDPWNSFVVKWNKDMQKRVAEGKFTYYENDFFVAYKSTR
jgi:hypothetical protein